MALVAKNLPVKSGDAGGVGLIPESGRSTGGGMEIHSNILAWRILCTEEPGRLWSIGLQSVGLD